MRDLVVVAFVAFTSFCLTLSALPLHAAAEGSGAGQAGLVTTALLVVTVLGQFWVPVWVARFGERAVVIAGLLLLAVPSPLYLAGRGLAVLLACSAVRGLGFAIVTVLLPLLAAALVADERRGEATGIYGLAVALPNLAAVPAGVALTAAGHFAVVAWLAAVPVLAIPFTGRLPRSTVAPAHPGPAGSPSPAVPDSTVVRTLRAVAGLVVLQFAVTMAGGALVTYLPIVRRSGSLATVALLVFGLTGALVRWLAGVGSDRWGYRRLVPIGVGVAVVGVLMLAAGVATGPDGLILAGAAVAGLGYGSAQNLVLLAAFDRVAPARRPLASAAWNAAFDTGTAVGAALIGPVAAGWGFGWALVGAAVVVAASLPFAVRR